MAGCTGDGRDVGIVGFQPGDPRDGVIVNERPPCSYVSNAERVPLRGTESVRIRNVVLEGLSEDVIVDELVVSRGSVFGGSIPRTSHGHLFHDFGENRDEFREAIGAELIPDPDDGKGSWLLIAMLRMPPYPGTFEIDGWRIDWTAGRTSGTAVLKGEREFRVVGSSSPSCE